MVIKITKLILAVYEASQGLCSYKTGIRLKMWLIKMLPGLSGRWSGTAGHSHGTKMES